MWISNGTTGAASDKQTLTQLVSIYEQLKLGIRWFDLRPMYRGPSALPDGWNWYCGHFTHALGWQGGLGQRIYDVVGDIKRFMAEQRELVILRISHVADARDGSELALAVQSTLLAYLHQELGEWIWQPPSNVVSEVTLTTKSLFVEVPAGTMKVVNNVQDFKLKDFLASGDKGCVVISSSDPGGGNGPHLSDFVYRDTKKIKLCFELAPNGVTVMQKDLDAILTSPVTAGYLFGTARIVIPPDVLHQHGVLGLCEFLLPKEMRAAPAKIMINGWATPVDMDAIQNDQCLTLALAGSLARLMMKYSDRFNPPVVAVYGGQQVTDKSKLNSIWEAVLDRSTFAVNNSSLGPDPWQGMRKSCVVYYLMENNKMTSGKYCAGRFALENEYLDFNGEFLSGSVHGHDLRDHRWRTTYWSFERALRNKQQWAIEMPNFSYNPPGDDPAPGVIKKVVIDVGKGAGPGQRSGRYTLTEGTVADAYKLLEFAEEGVRIF
jgi:hypothetical protein